MQHPGTLKLCVGLRKLRQLVGCTALMPAVHRRRPLLGHERLLSIGPAQAFCQSIGPVDIPNFEDD